MPILIKKVVAEDGWWIVRGNRQDTGALVRLLAHEDVSAAIDAIAFFKEFDAAGLSHLSFLPTDEAASGPREVLAYRFGTYMTMVSGEVLAARNGSPSHANDLGYALSYGVRDEEERARVSSPRFPVQIPWAEAAHFFDVALKGGELIAAHNLGHMRLHGFGGPVDFAEAFRLLKLAEPDGLPQTLELLAACYEQGLGVQADPAEAIRLRAKAAELLNKPH